MIEPNWNDLRIRVSRDQFITALQSQQRSRAFQLALGENTDDFAVGNSFSSAPNRSMRMPDIDRYATERTQKRVQNRFVIKLVVDDVTDRTRAGQLQNQGVHPADMIRHKKKPAVRQVFQTERSDPIKATHQRPANEIERALGARHGSHRL